MKPRYLSVKAWSCGSRHYAFSLLAAITGALFVPAPTPAAIVNNPTESDLRQAMTAGGTVTFACDGTITIASTITNTADTILDATGHQITISGNAIPAVGVFYVNSNRLTLRNLTLANGSTLFGGAIYNNGGSVTLFDVSLLGNHAGSEPWAPPTYLLRGGNGGAIYNVNGGSLSATNCIFNGNGAGQQGGGSFEWMGPPTGPCYGGAIDNEGGAVTLHECQFIANHVSGGSGFTITMSGQPVGATGGRNGCGGAIFNSGTLNATSCTFQDNCASGGSAASQPDVGYAYPPTGEGQAGASGGHAQGGAICNVGNAFIAASLFYNNCAVAGPGGGAGPGQSYYQTWEICGPGGLGGIGGDALGAGLFDAGTTTLINCTLASNGASGGLGGSGGRGGAVNIRYPCAGSGGKGGNGGTGVAAVYSSSGGVALTNCTIASNWAAPGNGGPGGPGGVAGASVGAPGLPGPIGLAGVSMQKGFQLNTVMAGNSPTNGAPTLIDLGHNLSSDASCLFTNAGSMNSRAAMLQPLANNGGPTMTMALSPISPAIDAADSLAAPRVDQRGFPRPTGAGFDIGACEYGSPALLDARWSAPQTLWLSVIAGPSQQFILQASSNLVSWVSVSTNTTTSNGRAVLYPGIIPGRGQFYRLRLP